MVTSVFARPTVHVWCKIKVCSAHGRECIVDEQRPGPGPVLFRQLMQRSEQSILSYGLTGV